MFSKESMCRVHKRCYCENCERYFKPLGIMRHRAMHKAHGERCFIIYSDGIRYEHDFSTSDNTQNRKHSTKKTINGGIL